MDDMLTRFVSDLTGRLHGPFSFRFVLQPLMALIYATRDGLAGARAGRAPYLWTMLTRPDERRRLLSEGWKAMVRVIGLGVIIDAIYQVIVFHWIHPLQLVVTVLGLAFLPYVLIRGPIGRIATWGRERTTHSKPRPFDGETDHDHRRTDSSRRRRHA
jgi:hypothetical protein